MPDWGVGHWCVLVLLLVTWICTISQALPHFLPAGMARLVNLACLGLYPLLLLATIWILRVHTQWLTRGSFDYAVLLVVSLGALGCYGIVRGNSYRIAIFDFLAYLPVLGGFLLGRFDKFWRWIIPPVLLLTAVSIVGAVRFTDTQVLTDRSILVNQVGSFFEGSLTLAPLLAIITATERSNRWNFPLLVVSLGAFFVYLYFGRRGISVRAAAEIFCAAAVIPLLVRNDNRLIRNVAILGAFAVALLAYFPFEVLITRYLGRYGFVDTVTSDNARWAEALLLWQELNWWETIVGRGLGGTFLVDRIEVFSFDEIDSGSFGKIGTHLGLALPVLKGGILFAIVYFLPALRLTGALPWFRRLDPITQGCAVAAPIWLAAQLIEGAISYSSPWVGLGVGLLISRAERIRLQYAPDLPAAPQPQPRPPRHVRPAA